MSLPTFGGSAIFGPAVVMSTKDIPRERQVNAFFGLSGVEWLDGGSRGFETHVSGLLVGPGEAGLRLALTLFRSAKDGQTHVLVDTLGIIWPFVLLTIFDPVPPVHRTPSGDRWCRYEAQFVHLIE